MSKRVSILALVLVAVWCITYDEMDVCNNSCDTNLKDCTFNPNFINDSYPKDVECGLDLQKRNLCMGYYDCKMGQTGNATVSFICWNCVLNSPSKSAVYSQYQTCMEMCDKKSIESVQ